MEEEQNKATELLNKLESLISRQEFLSQEITELKNQITRLQSIETKQKPEVKEVVHNIPPITAPVPEPPKKTQKVINKPPSAKINFEKFIGENLISKIGIIILVIGVGIGTKYAIEHQMINPLTRIVLGYLVGIGLLGFAIKLKNKYENYSAVLLSGSMAIMYFITFAGYSFYDLIPKMVAFALMVVFTIFTTLASIQYNKQVIAHIGFVGAYAVPFLLSDGTGSAAMLMSYMAIINIGILFVSIKKYWKSLYYSSFILTWLIYSVLYETELSATDDLGTLLTFLSIFFLTFYGVFIGYKITQEEKFGKLDVVLLMANSFVFYGLGYSILESNDTGEHLLGLFTVVNALVHFGVGLFIKQRELADRNLFYLVLGLVLTFITIAIPVQLDGSWVTLLWAAESALLFWIGRTKEVSVYEKLSYPLIVITFISVLHDWGNIYDVYQYDYSGEWMTPFLNISFASSLLVVAALGFINYIMFDKRFEWPKFSSSFWNKLIEVSVPGLFLMVLYFAFQLEIAHYWEQLYFKSYITVPEDASDGYSTHYNYALREFKSLWLTNYAFFFFTALSWVNIKKLKSRQLGMVNLGLNVLILATFLLSGLYLASELREDYLSQNLAEFYSRGWMYIGIRYISFVFAGAIVYTTYTYIKQEFLNLDLRMAFDFLLHTTLVWVLSSELIHWMDIFESSQSYKLGLSILWGAYALALIGLGIWKNKKYLRIGAISLFGVTLIKLFFYDLAALNTIAKTIVLVVLGALLLLASFLYNKYKNKIFGDGETNN